ncbi:hypothetical protein FACS189443_2520 [Planctomycetales bacterium]|nr:hypothetical protein FACS189443_2520 [Planctomycetales bacterium]
MLSVYKNNGKYKTVNITLREPQGKEGKDAKDNSGNDTAGSGKAKTGAAKKFREDEIIDLENFMTERGFEFDEYEIVDAFRKLVFYGTAKLRNEYGGADDFDKPAIQKRIKAEVEKMEIKKKKFAIYAECEDFKADKVGDDVSSCYSDVVVPFPVNDKKYVNRLTGKGQIGSLRFSYKNEHDAARIRISVSGPTDEIKELVRLKKKFWFRIVFANFGQDILDLKMVDKDEKAATTTQPRAEKPEPERKFRGDVVDLDKFVTERGFRLEKGLMGNTLYGNTLEELVKYGTAKLRDEFKGADNFDSPAIVKESEKIRNNKFAIVVCENFEAGEIRDDISSCRCNVGLPFRSDAANVEQIGSLKFSYRGGRTTTNMPISVSGPTDEIRELVRSKKGFRFRIIFTNLKHTSNHTGRWLEAVILDVKMVDMPEPKDKKAREGKGAKTTTASSTTTMPPRAEEPEPEEKFREDELVDFKKFLTKQGFSGKINVSGAGGFGAPPPNYGSDWVCDELLGYGTAKLRDKLKDDADDFDRPAIEKQIEAELEKIKNKKFFVYTLCQNFRATEVGDSISSCHGSVPVTFDAGYKRLIGEEQIGGLNFSYESGSMGMDGTKYISISVSGPTDKIKELVRSKKAFWFRIVFTNLGEGVHSFNERRKAIRADILDVKVDMKKR